MDSANRSINLNNEAPVRSSPWHLVIIRGVVIHESKIQPFFATMHYFILKSFLR